MALGGIDKGYLIHEHGGGVFPFIDINFFQQCLIGFSVKSCLPLVLIDAVGNGGKHKF